MPGAELRLATARKHVDAENAAGNFVRPDERTTFVKQGGQLGFDAPESGDAPFLKRDAAELGTVGSEIVGGALFVRGGGGSKEGQGGESQGEWSACERLHGWVDGGGVGACGVFAMLGV